MESLIARRPTNVVVVAMANKLAWKIHGAAAGVAQPFEVT
jgi:hypothetical protein